MGSSLDTKLIAFNINSEPNVSLGDDEIIDIKGFNEILNNAKNLDIDSLNLSSEEKQKLKTSIENFTKVQETATNEQIQKILADKDFQKDLSWIASIEADSQQNKIAAKNNETNQQIINNSRDTFIATGETTGQKDQNDPQYWEQLSRGSIQFDSNIDRQTSEKKLKATEETIKRFQNDPTNPENITKIEEVSTTIGRAKISLQRANEEQIAILENNNLEPDQKEKVQSLATQTSETTQVNSNFDKNLGDAVIGKKTEIISAFEKRLENPNLTDKARTNLEKALEKIRNTNNPDEIIQIIKEQLKAQGKSEEEINTILENIAKDQADNGKLDDTNLANIINEGWLSLDENVIKGTLELGDNQLTDLIGKDRTKFVTSNSKYIRENQLLDVQTLQKFDRNDKNYQGPERTNTQEAQNQAFSNKLNAILEPGEASGARTLSNTSNLGLPPLIANEISARYGIDRNSPLVVHIYNRDIVAINYLTEQYPELQDRLNKEIQGNFLPDQRINDQQNSFFGLSIRS